MLRCVGLTVVAKGYHLVLQPQWDIIAIVWSCVGLKQTLILLMALAVARGPWRHKAWYMPLGVILLALINLFRLSATAGLVFAKCCSFPVAHEVGKYAYYAGLFLLWVGWQELFGNHESDC